MAFSESYLLPFLQSTEAIASNIAKVYKKIRAVITLDKTITFAIIEPLNGSY